MSAGKSSKRADAVRDLAFSAACFFVAIMAWIAAGKFGAGAEFGAGPSLFPRLTAGVLGIVAVLLIGRVVARTMRGGATALPDDDPAGRGTADTLGPLGLVPVAAFFSLLALYILLLRILGFLPDSLIFAVTTPLLMASTWRKRAIAVGVVVVWAALIYAAIVHGLHIDLPQGRI